MNWVHALVITNAMYPIGMRYCDEDANTITCFNVTPLALTQGRHQMKSLRGQDYQDQTLKKKS